MYDTSKVINITKDDVLKKTSQYEIYATYLGFKPTIGEVYISPFRKDSNPSFGLYMSRKSGNIMFKDLGTGESGDCFKFASLIENVSTKQIIKNIYKQYVSNKVTRKPITVPIKEYKDLDIVVDDIPYTAEGLAFWADFGITENTLKLYNVKQIKKFWVNAIEYWTATKTSPMFAYFVYSKTKIYRPYYKKQKFYTNCTSIDIQGWEQLDYSRDTVYITKSTKDVMLLHELGYSAIAPNGEGHDIPDKVLSILRDKFKRIVILYDRDLPGLKASRKLWRLNKDLDFLFMPRKTEKDLSDYYRKYGKIKTLKLLSDYENKSNRI